MFSSKKSLEQTRSPARPPMERMMRIHQAILSGKYPNRTSLASELEVSSKSLQRDIDFMRDRLNLPLEYDPMRYGYFYTEEVANFPTMQMSEGELFAMLVAEKALQQYRGTSFERPLLSAFRKMTKSLPEEISFSLGELDEAISFKTTAEPVLDLAIFETLSKAAAGGHQLRLMYRKPGDAQPSERVIDPHHLANVNGEWFLFAWCHLRKGMRTFAPARVKSAERTGKKFKKLAGFSLESTLRDSFGVHSGDGEHAIVLRADEFAADYVREKKWHPSQKLREFPDGSVQMELKLSSLVEIQRWILGWGGHIQALRPPALVNALRDAGKKLAADHSLLGQS